MRLNYSIAFACAFVLNALPLAAQEQMKPEITAHLSGTAFVTTDVDASVEFYAAVLGYQERGRRNLSSEATTSVFGVPAGTSLEYVVMVPAEFSETNPNFPGLNFVGISDTTALDLPQNHERPPKSGELVLAFEVTNLEAIQRKVSERDIPIITPRALSATRKSETLTILDPNGIRVQLYAYVEPAAE